MDVCLSNFFGFEPNNHWAIYEAVGPPELRDQWTEIPEFQDIFGQSRNFLELVNPLECREVKLNMWSLGRQQ